MTASNDASIGSMSEFLAQCDNDEKVLLLWTLKKFAKAKSKSAQSRCMNEFADWYRQRRGLEPRTPKRVAGRVAE